VESCSSWPNGFSKFAHEDPDPPSFSESLDSLLFQTLALADGYPLVELRLLRTVASRSGESALLAIRAAREFIERNGDDALGVSTRALLGIAWSAYETLGEDSAGSEALDLVDYLVEKDPLSAISILDSGRTDPQFYNGPHFHRMKKSSDE